MSAALRKPAMTRDQFLDWVQTQDARHEFDGFVPVAMVGGSVNHSRIAQNIYGALYAKLEGSGCEPLGPDAGVATIGDTVRYPDALVACGKIPGDTRLVPGVVVVFEVLSPSSVRTDRILKLREYQSVASIRRYVIVESSFIGLTVLERTEGHAPWFAQALSAGDVLSMPEIGIEVPVDAFYKRVDFPEIA